MIKKIMLSVLFGLIIFSFNEAQAQWSFLRVPRVIVGASAGYFRVSLDNYTRYYDSRWDVYYSGQANVRVYRMNYLTVQYARFRKTNQVELAGEAEWNERFINVGVRWYNEGRKRWRYYAGFGFTFINVKEQAGFSLLSPSNPNDVSSNASGFFLEIGGDYIVLPHVALNLEIEVSSAGEGGTPGFAGSSLGGYAFLTGLNFHF
jgi:hypothetical protein